MPPHPLLGDLVRFLSSEVSAHGEESAALPIAMNLLECGMASRDPLLSELVAVSFIENLESDDPYFPAIRRLFGPSLEEQYREYEAFYGRQGPAHARSHSSGQALTSFACSLTFTPFPQMS